MSSFPRLIRRARRMAAVAAITATALVSASAVSVAAAPEDIPEGGVPQALHNFVHSPDAVPGANDWSCEPSADHPNPVVLLPGTFFNLGANFVKTAPRLANEGYCVFATNYGFTPPSLDRIGGLDSIKTSAAQLESFVDKVRTETGADKVDIVGHSQGGNVPMWWMKKMGGAEQVAHYVGWGQSSKGTTLDGIVNLGDMLGAMGFVTGLSNLGQFPGVIDQTYTSDYSKELWAEDANVASGPDYTVIATKQDKVVTPYHTQLLSGDNVNNIVLQDKCPLDQAGHIGLFNDDPTLQMTVNALADGPADFQPKCTGYGVQFL